MTQTQALAGRNGAAPSQLVSTQQWALMMDQAATLVASGLLPKDINTPQKAAAVMLKGRELRIPPMYALSNIVVINGKPAASAELLLALIYRDHGDDAIHFLRSGPEGCTISYARRGWKAREELSFTMEDARRAKVTESNPTWTKYPQAMCRARCVSAVARMAFPDSIGGMYTPEELGLAVEVNPDTEEVRAAVIDAPAREVPPTADAEARADAEYAAYQDAQAARFRDQPDQRPAAHGPAAPAEAAVQEVREGTAEKDKPTLTDEEKESIRMASLALGWVVADRQTWLHEHFAVTSFVALAPARREQAIRALEDLAAAVQGVPAEVGA